VSANAVREWSNVAPDHETMEWHEVQSLEKPAARWSGFFTAVNAVAWHPTHADGRFTNRIAPDADGV
jgi:hypothetical protein